MTKILITGGCGFIGSHIADALIERGDEVVVLDDLSTGRRENLNPKAVFEQGDICDRQRVEEIFAKHQPAFVFHLAAQINLRSSIADPARDAEINIRGSLNILEACKNHGVKKIIFSSTGGAIYGDTDRIPTPESHSPHPATPYGIAKFAVENYLRFYRIAYGLDYIVLRYANVYGPRQNPHGEAGVFAIFEDLMSRGLNPKINGDGSQTRDFVHVSDVVRANLLALDSEKSGMIYNIATRRETNVNEVFEILNQKYGGQFQAEHRPAVPGEQMRSCLDCALAKQELGWEPKIFLKA